MSVQPRTPAYLLLGVFVVASALLVRAPRRESRDIEAASRSAARSARVTGDLGPAKHECRFWALVGQQYPEGLLEEQLLTAGHVTLRSLGGSNRDGWGFAAFPAGGELRALLDGPLVRRGGPASDDPLDPNFERAVREISRIRPRVLLGHVRAGSSGHWGIPDPHPFLHRGFAFAHNGTVSFDICQSLMDAEMPGWRAANPPEYVHGNIDSEIYFQWLLCHAQAHPELPFTEAVREAVEIFFARVPQQRLNFVLSRGDTLWALRAHVIDGGDPVRYFPNDDSNSPYWVVASQPMGSEPARWSNLPETSLGVFVPGQAPTFYPVRAEAEPSFLFRRVSVAPGIDGDGDGSCCTFRVGCRPDVTTGRHPVLLRVFQHAEEASQLLAESDSLWLAAGGADSIVVAVTVAPDNLEATDWDLELDLVELGGAPHVVLHAGPDADPGWGLTGLRVEGSVHDTPAPPPPPPDRRTEVGLPRPNPARGDVVIPVQVAIGRPDVALQVWDARGALIHDEPRANLKVIQSAAGEAESAITWDGIASDGRRVPAGVYFVRIRAGDRVEERRVVVAR